MDSAKRARCKFVCDQISRTLTKTQTVSLVARYDSSLPEDQRFNEATPWGELKFGLNNPALADFFEPGRTYYIDVTAAED